MKFALFIINFHCFNILNYIIHLLIFIILSYYNYNFNFVVILINYFIIILVIIPLHYLHCNYYFHLINDFNLHFINLMQISLYFQLMN